MDFNVLTTAQGHLRGAGQKGSEWGEKDKEGDDGRKIQREEDRVQRTKRKNLWYQEEADGQSRTKGKKQEIKVASVENPELTQ